METNRIRLVLTSCLLVLVVTAGCVGADDVLDGDGPSPEDDSAIGDADEVDAADSTASPAGTYSGAPADRDLIRTATIDLRVESYESARLSIVNVARENGGYVSDSDVRLHRSPAGNWTSGVIVVRVPASNFDATFESMNEAGIVASATVESADVTEQLVDIDARLTTLEAQRDRLRELYDQANETDELLRIEDRITEVQTEIERLRATQRSLEDRVAYATITVELTEPTPDEPADPAAEMAWYDVGPLTAFMSSVDGVRVVLRALAVGGAYAAPFVLAFVVPVAGVAYVVNRLR